jgi:two-component system cell cycle response regulator
LQRRPVKILLVESDREDLDNLRERFSAVHGGEFDIEWAGELCEALARLTQGGIDAILLTLDLPDSTGMVTFERAFAFAPDVPIIVLTDEADEKVANATVQGGAQDYMVKAEVRASALARSVRYAIERHRLLSVLRSLSLIDDLTGLYNRRGFSDLGEQYLKLAKRTARGVTMVYMDLDRFKTINDSLGHHVGDRALLKVSDILKATFRCSDIIARIGGDEFGVLALEASHESSELLIERLRESVAEFNHTSREPYQLSVSIGIARHEDGLRICLDELIAEADNAMYKEKHSKRSAVLRQS